MFEKDMTIGILLDFYGEMLTERSRAILEQYYGDDLSLAEIADSFGISRQGVRHVIKHAEEQLHAFESALGLAEQFRLIAHEAEEIRRLALDLSRSGDPSVCRIGEEILSSADRILKKL